VPQFPYLLHGDNHSTFLIGFFFFLREGEYVYRYEVLIMVSGVYIRTVEMLAVTDNF
jgi:hypothetical protein